MRKWSWSPVVCWLVCQEALAARVEDIPNCIVSHKMSDSLIMSGVTFSFLAMFVFGLFSLFFWNKFMKARKWRYTFAAAFLFVLSALSALVLVGFVLEVFYPPPC